jgi:hypothetical protein
VVVGGVVLDDLAQSLLGAPELRGGEAESRAYSPGSVCSVPSASNGTLVPRS